MSHVTWLPVLTITILTLHINASRHDLCPVHSLTLTHLSNNIKHGLPLFSTPIRPSIMVPLR
jgi:hypothetical protein